MKINARFKHNLIVQNVLYYAILIAVVAALAWLSTLKYGQWDVSRSQRNTLSNASVQMLKSMPDPLQFVAYVPERNDWHDAVKKMALKYQKIKPNVMLSFVNINTDPAKAEADGVKREGQLVLKYKGRSHVVSRTDEQSIINGLQRIARDSPRTLIAIEGHHERSVLDQSTHGLSTLAQTLKSRGILVQPHNILRTQNVPTNTDILMLAAPADPVPDSELEVVKRYIANGGNFIWFQDPTDKVNLKELANMLGIRLDKGTLVDADTELQNMLGIQHPAVVPIIEYPNPHEVTSGLQRPTVFPFAGSISELDTDTDWNITHILTTRSTSWLERGAIESQVKFDVDKDMEGPLSIGVAMERFVTPEGSEKPVLQRVVVIADSDFVRNSFIGHVSNLDFSLRMFNWLAVDDELIQVDAATSPDVRFEMNGWLLYSMAIFIIFVLPIGLFVFGLMKWLARRKA